MSAGKTTLSQTLRASAAAAANAGTIDRRDRALQLKADPALARPRPLNPGAMQDLGYEAWDQTEVLESIWPRTAHRAETMPGFSLQAIAAHAAPSGATSAGAGSSEAVQSVARAGIANGGYALPYLSQIQSSFGHHDVSSARAHRGAEATEASHALGAAAYATGNDVVFAATPDLRTASHEAAHVVQQREGVYLKGGIGETGDRYEQQADAVAEAVVHGQSAEAILDGTSENAIHTPVDSIRADSVQLSPATNAPASPDTTETASTSVLAEIVGHASPRWEHTHGRSSAHLNLNLSRDRAQGVKTRLQTMLAVALADRPANVSIQCSEVDHDIESTEDDSPFDDRNTIPVETQAVGDSVTKNEASGNPAANDPSMRRVEITVTVTWNVQGEAGSTVVEDVHYPAHCNDNRTRDWAVMVKLSGSLGAYGASAGGAVVHLENLSTRQEYDFLLIGAGPGEGLATPGADPGWGSSRVFRTKKPCTFRDFTFAELQTTNVGGLLLGYSFAAISFPYLGVYDVDISGATMGAFGLDTSIIAGPLVPSGTPPDVKCYPEKTESETRDSYQPYRFQVPTSFAHTVYFDTESAVISDLETLKMNLFVENIAANYDWPGR